MDNITKHVEINRGLKYVTISCTDVNSIHNLNVSGRRSFLVSTLPVTTEQTLYSTVTKYIGLIREASVSNGYFNSLDFDVNTNVENIVDLQIILEVHVTK